MLLVDKLTHCGQLVRRLNLRLKIHLNENVVVRYNGVTYKVSFG